MADRVWFYADGGKQLGPFSEDQFRDLIATGAISAATYVWAEGMAGWQRAGDVPGLMAAGARPPGPPLPGVPLPSSAGAAGGPLSINLGTFRLFIGLFGWTLLLMIGMLLVIPAPWVATSFYRWIVARLEVPGRPNLGFTGQVGDIWWVFILLGLSSYVNVVEDSWWLPLLMVILQAFLSWMVLRWLTANLASNGQPLGLSFAGDLWVYVGWQILFCLSFITIIGWAWVLTAWMRWIARNIAGTRRAVVFTASGWEVLWRTLAFGIGCMFIIPIPWLLAWYTRWYAGQFALTPREAMATAAG